MEGEGDQKKASPRRNTLAQRAGEKISGKERERVHVSFTGNFYPLQPGRNSPLAEEILHRYFSNPGFNGVQSRGTKVPAERKGGPE